MRYIVLTDIHANLEALDACIADARSHGFDRALVLGDLVGYGGDPNAVVERIQGLEAIGVDEWIVYLMTEGQDETLERYGAEIIPAVSSYSRP